MSSGSQCPNITLVSCGDACTRTCYDKLLYVIVDACCNCKHSLRANQHSFCTFGLARIIPSALLLGMTLLLLAKRHWWWLPTGRPLGAALCAILMVTVLAPEEATWHLAPNFVLNQPGVVDMNMVVNIASLGVIRGVLTETGLLARLVLLLQYRCKSACSLLVRTCVLGAVCAALLTNDATVLILTAPVLEMAGPFNAPLEPFALALVTSANLGSALTLMGNPQNVLIANYSKMNSLRYFRLCAPVVLLGWVVNLVVLLAVYGPSLRRCRKNVGSAPADDRNPNPNPEHPLPPAWPTWLLVRRPVASVVRTDVLHAQHADASIITNDEHSLAASLVPSTHISPSEGTFHSVALRDMALRDSIASAHQMYLNRYIWSRTFAVVATLVALVVGFLWTSSISWVVLTAAAVLVIAECYLKPNTDHSASIMARIDGDLLLMIGGFFIVATGARYSGIPDKLHKLFDKASQGCIGDLDFTRPVDVVLFVVLVLTLSQLFSNVPTVMYLSDKMSTFDISTVPECAWIVLAFSSTVAGNLTLTGSAANLITAEKASLSGLELTYCRHLSFALPTTAIIAVGGALLIAFVSGAAQ